MKTKPLLFFLFIVPLLLLFSAIYYHQQWGENTAAAHKKYAAEYIAEWLSKSYVRLDPEDAFSNALKEVAIQSTENSISDNQKKLLEEELLSFFNAYHNGTYEAYLAFRRPIQVPFSWLANAASRLDSNFKQPEAWGSVEIGDRLDDKYTSKSNLLSVYTNMTLEEKFHTYVQDYSNGDFYKDYWEAVCLKEAKIIIDQTETMPGPLALYPFWSKKHYKGFSADATFPNLGYGPQREFRFFDFNDTMAEVLRRDGKLTFANCYFFVRCNEPGKQSGPLTVRPVLLRVYWVPSLVRWLPDDVVWANIRQFRSRFPVF